MNYEKDLIHWIKERERVRVKREVEKRPPPWTGDAIIAHTRFCNIRREDDKVTRWIKNNWRDPNSTHPNLAFSMALARVVNWPDTLERIGFPYTWDPSKFVEDMTTLSAGGSKKIWTGAYMVTGGFSKGGESKQTIIARVLSRAHLNCREIDPALSLKQIYEAVRLTDGLGTFLSAQVVADIKYAAPYYQEAYDWWTFCAPGPGSSMGLNFLHGRPPKLTVPTERFSDEVNFLRGWVQSQLGEELTAHDMQNCLCEFSKYVRIKYFKGRAKAHYQENS